jgi:hypothetical protein
MSLGSAAPNCLSWPVSSGRPSRIRADTGDRHSAARNVSRPGGVIRARQSETVRWALLRGGRNSSMYGPSRRSRSPTPPSPLPRASSCERIRCLTTPPASERPVAVAQLRRFANATGRSVAAQARIPRLATPSGYHGHEPELADDPHDKGGQIPDPPRVLASSWRFSSDLASRVVTNPGPCHLLRSCRRQAKRARAARRAAGGRGGERRHDRGTDRLAGDVRRRAGHRDDPAGAQSALSRGVATAEIAASRAEMDTTQRTAAKEVARAAADRGAAGVRVDWRDQI